jgi:hypothetical protein
MDRDNRIGSLTPALCGAIAALLLAGSAAAQQSGNNKNVERAVAMADLNLRDSEVRSLEIAHDSAKDPAKPKAAPETVEQVKQDFGRIQEISLEVLKVYATGGTPDYKQISRSMAEINKRARRLSTNLMLPESAADENRQGQDRSPLLKLNDMIQQFVTNPIFKNANTMDAELAARAKRDLVGIIDLSHRIEKSARKLAKDESSPK